MNDTQDQRLTDAEPVAPIKQMIRDLGDMACIGCRVKNCPACTLAANITNEVHILAARSVRDDPTLRERIEALVESDATFVVPTPGKKFDRTRVVRVADVRAVLAEHAPADDPTPVHVDRCDVEHPDAGCADVGCKHNCEADLPTDDPTRQAAAQALRDAADDLDAQLSTFALGGRHTRAWWYSNALRRRADRLAATPEEPEASDDENAREHKERILARFATPEDGA